MDEILLAKKQAFANLSAIQSKIDECLRQLKSNVGNHDQYLKLNADFGRLNSEWHAEYNKFISLEKESTKLIRNHMSKVEGSINRRRRRLPSAISKRHDNDNNVNSPDDTTHDAAATADIDDPN